MKREKPGKTEEVRAKIRGLVQQAMQEALEAKLDDFLGYPKHQQSASDNSRNGHSKKKVQTDTGPMDIEVPRDRKSDFEPKLIRKRQTVLDDLEDKIVAMYAKVMTTNNLLERIMREIRRRTRVVGAFPDGNSALMLVATRLRHIAATKWGTKMYMKMDRLKELSRATRAA